MMRSAGVFLGVAFIACAVRGASLVLANPGFEEGEAGWSIGDKEMSRIVPEAARTGKLGLRVTDTTDRAGSSCRSTPMGVTAGMSYAVRFWGRVVEESGAVAVYQQYFDAKGRNLTAPPRGEISLSVTGEAGVWQAFTLCGQAPEGAVALVVWVHSFNGAVGVADVDDFSVEALSEEEAARLRREQALTSRHGFPSPAPERVAAIAAWLPRAPEGLGRPASDREAWGRLAALPEAAGAIKAAEGLVGKPPPEVPDELYLEFTNNGNRRNYEKPYGERVKRINTLLLAECLENTGRFLPALERDILALCDERSWTMPAHDGGLSNFHGKLLTIDLGSSARGWLLATADYWLGARLTPAVRERMRQEVRRRVLDPYRQALRENHIRGNWWMRGDNNWNAVCTAGVVCSALALLETPHERAEILAAMEISNPHFIGGFTDDGYCSEGMGYWNYGFGHYVMMGLAVRAATGGRLDIFQGEKLRRIAEYARGYQIQPGRAPYFADGGGGPGVEVWAMMRQVWPEAVPASAASYGLLRGGHATVGLRAFGQEPPAPAEAAAEALPLRTWFADAQVLITRSAPGDLPPFGAAIKGGHNAEHHNHNDVGTYTVVLDNVEMLGDPGGEIYTRRTFSRERYVSAVLNSYGHPVPVVEGQLQPTGRQAAAKVVRHAFGDGRDSIELDLTAAYRVEGLERLRRAYSHARGERTLTIIDEARFTSPQTFSTPLVTYRKVFRKDAGTLYLFDDGGRCVEVRIEAEGGAWQLEDEMLENPGKASPRRLAVTFAQPVASARVAFRITPCAVPEGAKEGAGK